MVGVTVGFPMLRVSTLGVVAAGAALGVTGSALITPLRIAANKFCGVPKALAIEISTAPSGVITF